MIMVIIRHSSHLAQKARAYGFGFNAKKDV